VHCAPAAIASQVLLSAAISCTYLAYISIRLQHAWQRMVLWVVFRCIPVWTRLNTVFSSKNPFLVVAETPERTPIKCRFGALLEIFNVIDSKLKCTKSIATISMNRNPCMVYRWFCRPIRQALSPKKTAGQLRNESPLNPTMVLNMTLKSVKLDFFNII